jgi:PPOX class probable F420-dependent enzyme
MDLPPTSRLAAPDRARIEGRLRSDLMAWLTTVRPAGSGGQPVSVPVWFLLREDGSILIYTKPGTAKLRNIAANRRVSLALDGTDVGRDVVSFEGTARRDDSEPAADRNTAYCEKYAERIAAVFGSPERFAQLYSERVVVTPTRLHG